ncbi:Rib/alpha-like domain-containing protein [Lactobacillus crispatus]|uniref:Rib/alpha-like domain-containing protein n=1 Tax=Lactobacillus crispatus TaxID=47770 RepID=UPI003D6B0A90
MNKESQTLRKKQRFSLRKLNIGVASVLLGFTIFGYNLASQAPVAHAATSTATTASAGSGASGSSATGVVSGSQVSNSQAASQAPVAHVATSAVATASVGSGASGSSATGVASGSPASNSQAASATSSAANASQAAPATQGTASMASQSSAPANSGNATSLPASQAGTTSANHTAIGTTPSSQTVSLDEATSPAVQARTLMMKFPAAQSQILMTNLAVRNLNTADDLPKSAQNSGTDTTLPTTTQTYDKVEQPLLYDYLLHTATGTRDGQTWVDKTVAPGETIFSKDYPGNTLDTIFGSTSKPGIITSNPDKYFFAAYVDFSEQYHRVILLARGQDPSDKNLYSYTIHTYSQNTSKTTTKPGESIKEQYTGVAGSGGSKYDLIFHNYGDSFTVKLNDFNGKWGMLPVFDGGLLDPTYGSNSYKQNDTAAQTEPISFWASAILQETSTKVRYVDQATGKDIVQPMEISGFGYQGFKVKGEAPTVTGYHLVSKPEFLTSKASAYEDGTISPYKVGQTYDLALSDSVVIKQTVINTDGTVRATAYYKGSRIPSTSASKVLGRESYNDKMSFGAPDGKFYTYTNRIGQVDGSYIYYYAKDSDPDGSEMRLHFIDVTGVNNSNYAPSDGPELDVDDVQTIHGNIGENYNFTYTVPKGYDQVATSDVTGTYSKTHHDAYVYVTAKTPNPVTTPVKTNENTPLTDGQAKDAIANNSELPDGTTYTWSKQPDTTQPGDKTGEVTVHYKDGSSETVTVPVYVNSAADNNTPKAVKDPVKTNENTPLTDGQAKDAIANNSELPDGTTYTWSKQPDTTQPGDKTGEVTVHYKDGSSETVTVPVYVNSAADNNTPKAVKDPVKTNENTPLTDGQAKDAIANNSELPDGTTYTWSKQPDTTQPGDKTGEVTVHYKDGSSETVTVPVYVNSAADNNTPKAVKDPVKTNENTPLTDGQAKDAIANNSELPDGTTYTWSKQPDTTQPGDKTGEVTVHYKDGSSETVTVPVYVNSAADNNTPKAVKDPVKTNENTPLTDGQAKDAIANNSELPDGTTYTWSKQPDTTQPGDKTGEVTVHYKDGSSETVTVPVYVNSAADNNTPKAVKDPVKTNENTPLTDGQAKDAIANNSELPDGTTYTWSKQPDTTQPGDKTGEVTVHYKDGSSETVTVPVYVNSAADNNTPKAVKDPVKTNENTPLTDGQAKDAIANNSELPDGTTYTWSKQPDTTQPGDKTGEVTVHYKDGSSETVTVPVYVNSAADNNTPKAVKDPVKTNENTPLTDGQAKDAIANNSELPDGTTYTWSKQPDTTQPGDKTGEVTVHYKDGSSETVTVPVYVNSAADNNTPKAVKDPVKTNENTPLTDGQAKDAIANNSELPDGTTYTWSKQPDTTQPGDKTGEVTVHYKDGSSETVTVPVYVNSAADNNTPKAVKDPVKTNENTPLTDGQAKDAIANNSELPDGTTYTWSKQPDTTQPGDKTGEVTVHYKDGSSETVTVPVYVNSAADNNTPKAVKDPVKTNENTPLTDGQAKDAIANNSELPDGTTYTWSKQPDTTQPGDKTGEVTVHYKDGSSETVTVPVYVNSAADNNTPKAVKDPVKTNENTPLTDGQAKDAIANNSELPDGTTYTWSKQPDTTQPGDKTGEVTVHYKDGSSETVTVPVYVNSAADNNTPKAVKDPVKTNENTPLTDGQAKDAIANNSELPDGTTYTWSKQPDTTQPGDKTGEVTVHYKDGSSETVTVPVYVNSAADNNTPKAVKDPVKTNENTPLTDGQAKDAIANNSELPDGTTYTWSKQPDTTQPGDKTGEVTVHYKDGSSETVTVPVYVNSAADNNTPKAVKDPVKTNENTPLTDGQAKDAIANNSELPDGTTYTWSKQPDTTQPGDKTGEVTVHYKDGSSETVTVPVYVNSAADNNTPKAVKDPVKTNENTPLTDGQAKDAIANNSELPDGTTYTWSKQPDTTQPGDKTGEVTVHYKDGSSETVTVPVYVNSAADNNTPKAVKDPVKTNENTPLTDGQAKDAIANNSELPDGTTYTWSKQPDTTQPGDKTGEVTVHYKDGSSETVTVPVYVNSAADNNTPKAVKDPVKTNENTPLTDGQAKDAIANNSELPDGTTYTWSKQPDTTQPGDKTGEVTVHYKDGSSETVTVPVYVNSAADNNTPKAVKDPVKTNENTPLTDGQAKDAIANNSELPDGTTYTWSKQPDTTQPGDKTGEVTVHYKDGSSETVTVPVYVNSAADNNTPKAVKDPVKTNENTPLTDGQAKDAIANNSELPDGTTYTWSKQPDTTQPGDKTGEVTVHYKDGSSETVTVPVYVNSAADNNTPKAVKDPVKTNENTPLTDGQAKDAIANNSELPDGTTYTWSKQPDTTQPGDKTGEVTVHYKDGSSETVTVPVYVNSAADNNTPKVSTPTVDQNAEVDPNSVVTNKDNLPKGTTYSWTTKPDTSKAGQPATGSLHVAYPDGSSKDVPVTVNVKSNADQYTPTVPGDKVTVKDPSHLTEGEKDQVKTNVTNANKDKFPAGTKVTVGDDGTATVTYPDGSKDTIPGDQLVQGQKGDTTDAGNITPTIPGGKVTVKDPSHLTDDEKNQVKNNVDNANKDKFPAGTEVTVGDDGTTTVTYPDGTKDTIPGDQLVQGQKGATTDAGNITPTISGGKVTVKDPSHLTDDEKNQVKKNVEDANKDKFPAGTEVTVGDDGTTTVTYPDGSKDVIAGTDLVIAAKSEDVPGSKHHSHKNGSNSSQADRVKGASTANGSIANAGNNLGVKGESDNAIGNNKATSLKTLPQTGTKDTSILGVLGMLLASLGLFVFKKKRDKE